MNLRREFIELALQDGRNRRELCRRYGISAKTGYALLKRYQEEDWDSLKERSRRPCWACFGYYYARWCSFER